MEERGREKEERERKRERKFDEKKGGYYLSLIGVKRENEAVSKGKIVLMRALFLSEHRNSKSIQVSIPIAKERIEIEKYSPPWTPLLFNNFDHIQGHK